MSRIYIAPKAEGTILHIEDFLERFKLCLALHETANGEYRPALVGAKFPEWYSPRLDRTFAASSDVTHKRTFRTRKDAIAAACSRLTYNKTLIRDNDTEIDIRNIKVVPE